MSAIRPNCSICLSPQATEINRLIRQGTGLKPIATMLVLRKSAAIAQGHAARAETILTPAPKTLRTHKKRCLLIFGAETQYVPAGDISTPGGLSIPKMVSAAELADPAKRLDLLREALASKIHELSAKDLYAMYMAELKLQTAQAERDEKVMPPSSPETPDDGDALDAAMAQASGHRPDLRVVSGSRGKVARR